MAVERKVMDETDVFLERGSILLPRLELISPELEALASLAMSASLPASFELMALLLRDMLPTVSMPVPAEGTGLCVWGKSSGLRSLAEGEGEGSAGNVCAASS